MEFMTHIHASGESVSYGILNNRCLLHEEEGVWRVREEEVEPEGGVQEVEDRGQEVMKEVQGGCY